MSLDNARLSQPAQTERIQFGWTPEQESGYLIPGRSEDGAGLVPGAASSRGSLRPFVDFLRRRLWAVLERISHGRLTLVEGRSIRHFGSSLEGGLEVTLRIQNASFYKTVALRGSLGAAEAYMDGAWTTDNLTGLIRLVARNRTLLESLEGGTTWLAQALLRMLGLFHRNTRRGSRRNILQHYDLGNDFFALFLDETMMYSSAYFDSDSATLYDASIAKLDRICHKLRLQPGDRVVEIGTGWGGFAIHAARKFGCQVVTTTVSDEQFSMAQERVLDSGLADRVIVLKKDYRDLEGDFDKLVSIEMIEAVGHAFLETYFRVCDRLLVPGGRMLLQAITIAGEHFERSRNSVDFIKQYVFPGSELPAISQLMEIVGRTTRLKWVDSEDISLHYARTLHLWRERFRDNRDQVRKLGFPERFIRMWDYYLAYCEGGFLERHIGDYQITLVKH